jgi:gas vesicle protein
MDTFKEKISQFAQTQEDRMDEVQNYSRHLFARVKKEYDSIHEDFRYAAYSALAGFQKSVFKEYLDAELNAFKDAVSTFAKAQSERLGELQTYIHNLFTRVRAQHEQLHDDFKQNVQESFDAFRDSIQGHLEQLFGSVPVQIEGLS